MIRHVKRSALGLFMMIPLPQTSFTFQPAPKDVREHHEDRETLHNSAQDLKALYRSIAIVHFKANLFTENSQTLVRCQDSCAQCLPSLLAWSERSLSNEHKVLPGSRTEARSLTLAITRHVIASLCGNLVGLTRLLTGIHASAPIVRHTSACLMRLAAIC
jgi:hypothetical protein